MQAEVFKLIREVKERQGLTWEEITDMINEQNETNIDPDQLKDFIKRGKVLFGGWLIIAIEQALKIPPRMAKSYKSFKDGGSE